MFDVFKPSEGRGSEGGVSAAAGSKGIPAEGLVAVVSQTPSPAPCILCLVVAGLFGSIALCISAVVWLSGF
jgi:hypothetical protein